MTDINDKLKQLTKKELIIECKKYKISGYSNKTKDQIIKLILSNNNHIKTIKKYENKKQIKKTQKLNKKQQTEKKRKEQQRIANKRN